MLKPMTLIAAACLALAPALAPRPALAEYPERPVTLIVPYPPGGTIDRLSRELAEHLGQAWGQAVIVENHAGGNGAVGTQNVLKAAPDGYTLLVGGGSTHSVGPATDANLSYDPVGDFTPVAYLGDTPMVLTAGPAFAPPDFAAMIAAAKEGGLLYGSVGNSTVLAGTLLAKAADVRLRHANYKQFGPLLIDLVRGDVPVAISSLSIVIGNIQQNMVRALAVTSPERSPLLPDVPAVAETYPGFEVLIWFGLFGPKDLPAGLADRLHDEVGRYVADKARAEKWAGESFTLRERGRDDFAAFLAADLDKWRKIAAEAGIAVQ